MTNHFFEIVRHIRNSIAHGRFEFKAEQTPSNSEPNVVHSVKFQDIHYNDKAKKFKMILSVELLEKFMLEIANTILKEKK